MKPEHATPDNALWGLYDTGARQWLGDDTGPLLYDGVKITLDLAQAAAVIVNEQYGYIARIRLCAYDGTGVKRAGDVKPKRTFAEALARIEGAA